VIEDGRFRHTRRQIRRGPRPRYPHHQHRRELLTAGADWIANDCASLRCTIAPAAIRSPSIPR